MFDKQTDGTDSRWLMLMMKAGDIGPARLRRLLEAYGDADRIFDAGRRACADIIGRWLRGRLFDKETEQQVHEVEQWLRDTPQADFVCWADPDFPKEVLAYEGAPLFFPIEGQKRNS